MFYIWCFFSLTEYIWIIHEKRMHYNKVTWKSKIKGEKLSKWTSKIHIRSTIDLLTLFYLWMHLICACIFAWNLIIGENWLNRWRKQQQHQKWIPEENSKKAKTIKRTTIQLKTIYGEWLRCVFLSFLFSFLRVHYYVQNSIYKNLYQFFWIILEWMKKNTQFKIMFLIIASVCKGVWFRIARN